MWPSSCARRRVWYRKAHPVILQSPRPRNGTRHHAHVATGAAFEGCYGRCLAQQVVCAVARTEHGLVRRHFEITDVQQRAGMPEQFVAFGVRRHGPVAALPSIGDCGGSDHLHGPATGEVWRHNPGIGDTLVLPAPKDPSKCVSRSLVRDSWE